MYFGSGPTDPSYYDETIDMWIEDCAARRVLARSLSIMPRCTLILINILSFTAVRRMASLSQAWCDAVDCSFQDEYFLMFRELLPHIWDYISARWTPEGILKVTARSQYIGFMRLTKLRKQVA